VVSACGTRGVGAKAAFWLTSEASARMAPRPAQKVLNENVYLAHGAFYTSGTFLAEAALVAAVLGTIATIWVTILVSTPRKRLLYSMPAPTPVTENENLRNQMSVGYGAKKLEHPHVVNIELTSRGRRDISRDDFESPLAFDVGAVIVECMKTVTLPPGRPDPIYSIDGSRLIIGPCLINKRQATTFSLLIDGPGPRLISPPVQSLINVEIRQVMVRARVMPWRLKALGISAFVAAFGICFLEIGLNYRALNSNVSNSVVVAVMSLVIVGGIFMVLSDAWSD
jgi:hypothetical protein